MKLSQTELVLVVLLIAYVSFFTHPPPLFVKQFFKTPVGHALFLLALLWVAVYQSLIVAVFMGVAYIMTATSVTEYLDPTEQKPESKATATQPKAAGVPAPIVADLLKDIMKKGDKPAHHAKAGKSVTAPPPSTQQPKPAPPSAIEKFSSF